MKKKLLHRFKTRLIELCPICEEREKCIELHHDLHTGVRVETLRCRYCRHNFEDLRSQLDAGKVGVE